MNALIVAPATQVSELGNAVFDRVPEGCAVVVMAGHVVVYDEDFSGRWPLEDGGFYVMEHQRPPHGMSREVMTRLETQCLLVTDREVVRVFRRPALTGDLWWYSHSNGRGPKFDGPMEDFNLAGLLVGKVLGLFETNITPLRRAA